ncbi:unnamed protein product [Didymodactylos carnosus]|uniref:Uncharacterized protein n=1 Tax=Didymodactylos carnosus TaxID=1234261 RepID=A0A815T5Z9_9BILA|nr:unnamed protein product [Didymodactylos carnosus]CAF4360752.1 unnamed protein product [Didymodactylos carnosus]
MATSSIQTSSPSSHDEMNFDQLFTIYHIDCRASVEQAQERILEFFGVPSTENNTYFIQSKIKNFIAKKKDKFDEWRKHRSAAHHKEKFLAPAILKGEFPDKPKPPKRPTQNFTEVGPRQKRQKLNDLNSELDDFATDNGVTVNQVIGYLLHQRNYNINKHLAQIGDELYKKGDVEELTKFNMNVDGALALKTHINLSRSNLDFIKTFQKDFVQIPNRNIIREHSQKLVPEITECREKRGIMVGNSKETIELTISRILERLTQMNIVLPSKLTYKYKTGHDGAGSQSVYRSLDNPMNDPNIFAKMFVPLSLTNTQTDEVVWKNDTPNSAFYTSLYG